jgi:hypothetical protein
MRGPAQSPFGFGLTRYREEILRCEGHSEKTESGKLKAEIPDHEKPLWGNTKLRALPGRAAGTAATTEEGEGEKIADRYMDSRYGATPTTTKEAQTTLLEQMADVGMEFLAASGKDIIEGVDLIHELLDYDREVKIGEWSPRLARINEPLLKISRDCPNTIFALKTWTGKDKGKGACKDFVDLLRYGVLADLQYIGPDSFVWKGGGRGY